MISYAYDTVSHAVCFAVCSCATPLGTSRRGTYTGMITLTFYRYTHIIQEKVRRRGPGNTLFISSPSLLLSTSICFPRSRGLHVGWGSRASPPRVFGVVCLNESGRPKGQPRPVRPTTWTQSIAGCFCALGVSKIAANASKVKIYIRCVLNFQRHATSYFKTGSSSYSRKNGLKSERKQNQNSPYFLCRQRCALLGPL